MRCWRLAGMKSRRLSIGCSLAGWRTGVYCMVCLLVWHGVHHIQQDEVQVQAKAWHGCLLESGEKMHH